MKKIIFTWLFVLLAGWTLNAQISGNGYFYSPAKNYGYTSGILSANASVPIANNTKFVTTQNHLYYTGTNGKLCEYFFNGTNWVGGSQLEWDWVFVNTATSPINDGDDVFFIGTDSKIYKTSWTSTNGWHSTMLDAAQSKLCDASFPIIFKEFNGAKKILYVCATTKKICSFTKSGSTWSYSGEMNANANSEPVRAGTQIIYDGWGHVFYIGANTGRIHNYWWNGSSWGDVVLNSSSTQVMAGTNIQFDGNDLYYIGTNKHIYRMYWASNAWQVAVITSTANAEATSFFTYHNNKIYYGETYATVPNAYFINCLEKVGGSWTGSATHVTTNDYVTAATEINVVSNPIYYEGSTTNFFYSHQVSYRSMQDGRVHYSILDYYLGDESTAPMWHKGLLNSNAPAFSYYHTFIGYNPDPDKKLFIYPGTNGYMNFFTRKVKNDAYRTNMHLTFQQEFNTADPGLTQLNADWNINWPWGSGGAYETDNSFYHSDITHNCAISNGDLTLATIQETGQGTEYGSANPTNDAIPWNHPEQCTPITYNYTSQQVHTGYQNAYWSGCGPWHEDAKFEQTGGVFESRLKIPRAKDAWPAFWFISTTGEIDFELGGNGKNLLCNSYWSSIWRLVDEPAVGYRFYDDYYTLAIKPTSTGITWYLNNEEIFQTSEQNYYPTTPLMILVQQIKVDRSYGVMEFPSLFADNEIANFPNYLNVDYVRVFQNNTGPFEERTYNTVSNPAFSPSQHYTKELRKDMKVNVYPNPIADDGKLRLDLGTKYEKVAIEIQNGLGQPVQSVAAENKSTMELDMSQCQPGLYLVKISCDNNKPVIKKVIKQ